MWHHNNSIHLSDCPHFTFYDNYRIVYQAEVVSFVAFLSLVFDNSVYFSSITVDPSGPFFRFMCGISVVILIGRDKLFDAEVCSSRQGNHFLSVIFTVSHESSKFVIMFLWFIVYMQKLKGVCRGNLSPVFCSLASIFFFVYHPCPFSEQVHVGMSERVRLVLNVCWHIRLLVTVKWRMITHELVSLC